jgi:hypothetical protein
LDIIETKILRPLHHAIHSHLHQRILVSPIVFLNLRFLEQQLKVGGGLALFTVAFVLSLIKLYLYVNTSFPQ